MDSQQPPHQLAPPPDERDRSAHGRDLLRVDDLARATGITVRTLRSYLGRGLLPPPTTVVGRTNFYDASHVARLRIIAELLGRNYTLDSIAELIHAREAGQDLQDIIGMEVLVTAPWSDEKTIVLTTQQFIELYGFDDPAVRDEAVELGYIAPGPEPDTWVVPSMQLVNASRALTTMGVGFPEILALGRALKEHGEAIATLFTTLVDEHVFHPFDQAGMPAEQLAAINEFMTEIRQVTGDVVQAHVAMALDRQAPALIARLGEHTQDPPTTP